MISIQDSVAYKKIDTVLKNKQSFMTNSIWQMENPATKKNGRAISDNMDSMLCIDERQPMFFQTKIDMA